MQCTLVMQQGGDCWICAALHVPNGCAGCLWFKRVARMCGCWAAASMYMWKSHKSCKFKTSAGHESMLTKSWYESSNTECAMHGVM